MSDSITASNAQVFQRTETTTANLANAYPMRLLEQDLSKERVSLWVRLVSKGIANALRGLSDMVNDQILVTSLDLRWLPIRYVSESIGRQEAISIGIYLSIEGDAKGHLVMLYDIDTAFKLIDIQLSQPSGSTQRLGDMERSVLGEIGNIIGSLFLNVLADSGNLMLMPSSPMVVTDRTPTILDIPLTLLMEEQDDVLLVEATFSANNHVFDSTFLVLPTMELLHTILARQAR